MKGTVVKINPYKSGTGCFIGLKGEQKDFMHFGNPNIKLGDEVEYLPGKPTKDGNPTIREIRRYTVEEFVDEDKPRSASIQDEIVRADKLKPTPSKDEIITRLACLKAASEVYSGGQTIPSAIIRMAKEFEKYAKTGD
jgi:hypothetical protein